MLIVLLMFIIPAAPFSSTNSENLVDWMTVQRRLAWGLLFMRGGGFSLADAVEVGFKYEITIRINHQNFQLIIELASFVQTEQSHITVRRIVTICVDYVVRDTCCRSDRIFVKHSNNAHTTSDFKRNCKFAHI